MRSFYYASVCWWWLVLGACDEPAQPRPPHPNSDAAVGDAGGTGGSAGGGGSAGRGGSGASQSCEASAPPIMPAVLPAAVVGKAYAQTLSIVGATEAQVDWTADMLPPGLMLIEEDSGGATPAQPQALAELTGTPTKAGTFSFEVMVSLIPPTTCVSPPASRMYDLLVTDPNEDADAGTR